MQPHNIPRADQPHGHKCNSFAEEARWKTAFWTHLHVMRLCEVFIAAVVIVALQWQSLSEDYSATDRPKDQATTALKP